MSQESAATKAMTRDQLAVLRRRMRREAANDEAVCRLAARMNVRPDDAADHLGRLSRHSGIDLLEGRQGGHPAPGAGGDARARPCSPPPASTRETSQAAEQTSSAAVVLSGPVLAW
ncbi:hypothetical protein [Nonomuraea dietziae]|uniref:hypothetical protein n=1 Tax=Nonomuraea dietziae TaxID=65515 RepID=UPI0033F6FF43